MLEFEEELDNTIKEVTFGVKKIQLSKYTNEFFIPNEKLALIEIKTLEDNNIIILMCRNGFKVYIYLYNKIKFYRL